MSVPEKIDRTTNGAMYGSLGAGLLCVSATLGVRAVFVDAAMDEEFTAFLRDTSLASVSFVGSAYFLKKAWDNSKGATFAGIGVTGAYIGYRTLEILSR